MKSGELLRLSIAGAWSDGWLYKDHLFLWGEDGYLLHAPTQRLVGEIRREYGEDLALAAQIALFRNDWKGGIQTSAFLRSAAIKDAMLSIIRAASGVPNLSLSLSSFESVDIEAVPGFLLSVSIYGNHAFIGSSDGLFETNLNPQYLSDSLNLIQRLESPVHGLDANYGAIAASAFEEGLWFDRIDFGDGGAWLAGGPLDRVADYSRGVSMASRDLLNFTDEYIPDLYLAEATHELQSDRARYPSWQITGYQRASAELSTLSARSFGVSDENAREGHMRLLANSKQRLLFDVGGTLRLLQLRTLNGVRLESAGDLAIQFGDLTRGAPTVSTLPLGEGFIVETTEQLTWLSSNGTIEISAHPAVTVRTFPNSKHFNDTALITMDERADLIGFLDFPRA